MEGRSVQGVFHSIHEINHGSTAGRQEWKKKHKKGKYGSSKGIKKWQLNRDKGKKGGEHFYGKDDGYRSNFNRY